MELDIDEKAASRARRTDDGEPNIKFWVSQLEAAKEAAKWSNQLTNDAYDEYLYGLKLAKKNQTANETRYPLYWASVQTIQPALYSRTPIPVIEKSFDDLSDRLGALASTSLERLAKYLIRKCPFDRVMYATRDTFIHHGKAAPRVFYDGEVSQTYYEAHEEGGKEPIYLDESGQPAPEGVELQEDEDGRIYSEKVERAEIQLVPVHYADVLHTPNARHEEEITWRGFKNLMTRDECKRRFPKTYEHIKYSSVDSDEEAGQEKRELSEPHATVWEIWDFVDRKVMWLDENNDKVWLDVKNDPWELAGFWPQPPFMLGTTGPDDLYSLPDYTQLKPIIDQMHGMARRLRRLVRATRRRGIFDNNIQELAKLNSETDEAEFVGVSNYQHNIVGKGGLKNVIEIFPTQEFVEAIRELVATAQIYEERFNQIWGIPDILRGVSDPRETAAAQQLKGKFLSLRFSAKQREFQRLCRDCIELMCDLALKKFPETKLQKIMGLAQWQQADQALWPQVLALLQDDRERCLRIDIETDSTITMNENAEIEQRNYLAKTLFDGISQITNLEQASPQVKALVAQTVLYVVRGVRDSAQIESTLEAAVSAWMQEQPQQQPQPQEQDTRPQELQLEAQKMQVDAQIEQQKLQLKAAELRLKAQQFQLEYQRMAMEAQDKQVQASLQARSQQLDEFVKSRELDIEAAYVELDMQERFLTEARLQQEAEQKEREAAKPEGPGSVTINLGGG